MALPRPGVAGTAGGRCPPDPPGYFRKDEAASRFAEAPCAARLADGRLWLRHGPIEIFALAEGPGAEAAHHRAAVRFVSILGEVAAHLPELRRPPGPGPLLSGIPGRMQAACRGHHVFVTPMAAVAGAVAEAVLAALIDGPGLVRAHVNNGGDIALWQTPGAAPFRVGLVSDLARAASPGWLAVGPGTGGIATSGWPGRSHSLGIADAVTVLASRAAEADVAATLIANAVDLPDHPGIRRRPACEMVPDSDLGARLVTRAVPSLNPAEIARALDAGAAFALRLVAAGRIQGAALALQGTLRLVGAVPFHPHQEASHG